MVGVAVNVLEAPAQEGFVPLVRAMDILGAIAEFTVTDMESELAGLPVTPAKLDVMTQDTVCPLVKALVVKVGEFVPTLVVPTFHW